mgnify:CR=1 FL=1|jgi:hypothetical protein
MASYKQGYREGVEMNQEERDKLLGEMVDHAIENDLYEKTKGALPKKELK